MSDFDYQSIDGIEDCDDDQVNVLVLDRETGDYGWHWIYRDTLAENDRPDIAMHGLMEDA